uniref:Uncharacterized protein n=1 Tax=Panagrellus redivivus TaxID=6233 RepID=A0A7E4VEN2_PANRE
MNKCNGASEPVGAHQDRFSSRRSKKPKAVYPQTVTSTKHFITLKNNGLHHPGGQLSLTTLLAKIENQRLGKSTSIASQNEVNKNPATSKNLTFEDSPTQLINMVAARSAQTSSAFNKMLVAMVLVTILAAANAHPFVYGSDIQAPASFNIMPKRSLASGRWGLRPGKRSYDADLDDEDSHFAARFPYRFVLVD